MKKSLWILLGALMAAACGGSYSYSDGGTPSPSSCDQYNDNCGGTGGGNGTTSTTTSNTPTTGTPYHY
jgi:hypothetical protein